VWLLLYSTISCYSVAHILPSFLKRRGVRRAEAKVSKKPKTVKTWDRDVLCIPKQRNLTSGIKYPIGKYRAHLASNGLIGKLHLTSEMTDKDVECEIRSIFREPMQNNPNFPFLYLQSTGGGAKLLTAPSQSSSFKWIPQQVARLSSQSGTIYILAQADLHCTTEEDSSESEVCNLFCRLVAYNYHIIE